MWGKLKAVLRILLMIPVVLVAALIAESIPLLHVPDAYFADNPGVKTLLISLCAGMATIGYLILVVAQFVVRRPRAGELTVKALGKGVEAEFSPMDRREVKGLTASNRAAAPSIWRRFAYRLRGSFVGRSFSVAAVCQGGMAHRRMAAQPVWQLLFIMAFGATLMLFGLFGPPVVPGPSLVRLIGAGAILYAVSRAAWALYKA